jgi:hypothetical protein
MRNVHGLKRPDSYLTADKYPAFRPTYHDFEKELGEYRESLLMNLWYLFLGTKGHGRCFAIL